MALIHLTSVEESNGLYGGGIVETYRHMYTCTVST